MRSFCRPHARTMHVSHEVRSSSKESPGLDMNVYTAALSRVYPCHHTLLDVTRSAKRLRRRADQFLRQSSLVFSCDSCQDLCEDGRVSLPVRTTIAETGDYRRTPDRSASVEENATNEL